MRSVPGPEDMVLRRMTAAALGMDLTFFGDRQHLVCRKYYEGPFSEEGGESESVDDDDIAEEGDA